MRASQIGILNVRAKTGKGQEIDERRERGSCVQETRRRGSETRDQVGGSKLFYHESDGQRNTTGIILKKKRILLAAPEKVERTDKMNGYENGCKRVYSQYRKGIRATIQLRGRRRKKVKGRSVGHWMHARSECQNRSSQGQI